jgi:hypothetical protein
MSRDLVLKGFRSSCYLPLPLVFRPTGLQQPLSDYSPEGYSSLAIVEILSAPPQISAPTSNWVVGMRLDPTPLFSIYQGM